MIVGDEQAQHKSIRYRDLWALLALALVILLLCYWMGNSALCSLDEGIGVYHVTARAADLDSDGDQDVIVAKRRWEAESASWTGISLWFNLGEGLFALGEQGWPGGFSSDAGDLDGDGDADLLTLEMFNSLEFFINQGGIQGGETGSFGARYSAIAPPYLWPGHWDTGGSVMVGDLNGDGAPDGFVAGCCYPDTRPYGGPNDLNPSASWVWINAWTERGAPVYRTLNLAELFGVPILGAALGDLDGDGDLDVYAAVGTLVSPAEDFADLILLNDSQGNFSISNQQLSQQSSSSVALGDLDRDGDLDALVGTRRGAEVWVNQGGSQGGRQGDFAASDQVMRGKQTNAVFLADLDRDGDLDALVAGLTQARIWLNDGRGAFTRSNQRFNYTKRHGLAVADLDGDGDSDIFGGAYTDDYRVWLNQGDGTFQGADSP